MKSKKYTVYLYYKSQFIKKVRVSEDFNLQNDVFIVNVFGKKHLFGTLYTKVVCKFYKLKYQDDKKKIMHCEIMLYDGKEIT